MSLVKLSGSNQRLHIIQPELYLPRYHPPVNIKTHKHIKKILFTELFFSTSLLTASWARVKLSTTSKSDFAKDLIDCFRALSTFLSQRFLVFSLSTKNLNSFRSR